MKTLNNHHTCYPYLSSAEGWEDEHTHSGQWLHVCETVSGCRAGPAWYQGAVVTLKPHFALCQNQLSKSSAPNELTKETQRARLSSPQYWPTGALQHGSKDMSGSVLALSCEWQPLGLDERVLETSEQRKQGILTPVKSDILISPELSAHHTRFWLAQDGRGSDRSAGCICNKAEETEEDTWMLLQKRSHFCEARMSMCRSQRMSAPGISKVFQCSNGLLDSRCQRW